MKIVAVVADAQKELIRPVLLAFILLVGGLGAGLWYSLHH